MEPMQGNKLIIPSRPYMNIQEKKFQTDKIKEQDVNNAGNFDIVAGKANTLGNMMRKDITYEKKDINPIQIWDYQGLTSPDKSNLETKFNNLDINQNYSNIFRGLKNEESKVMDGNNKIDKIKIPGRDYTKPAPTIVLQSPQPPLLDVCSQDDLFLKVKLSLDAMRKEIEINLDKTINQAIEGALSQLKKIDNLEISIYAQFFQGKILNIKEYKLKSKAYNIIINDLKNESTPSPLNIVKKENSLILDKCKEESDTIVQKYEVKDMIGNKCQIENDIIKESKNLVIGQLNKSPIGDSENNFKEELKVDENNSINKVPKSPILFSQQNFIAPFKPLLVALMVKTIIYSTDLKSINAILTKDLRSVENCIPFGNDKILCARSDNSFFSYNIFTKTIDDYPNFLITRTLFGIGFIEDNIAIIGGMIGNATIESVEIFENNQWKLIEPLKSPKSHCRVLKHNNKTYVSGRSNGINVSIEKYESGWILIEINISWRAINCELVSCENYIYIFGGKQYKKRVLRYDTDSNVFSKCIDLKKNFNVRSQGSGVHYNNTIYLLSGLKEIQNYMPATALPEPFLQSIPDEVLPTSNLPSLP
ncbi:hypothetical protein SteCoe_18562 [Stentor coeruleus]|uniref:Kelch motif family protein n=1 Tax=Stentor coeruleus TaxID=5963 RepID=A0A1R2BWT3_9CILI|nr:hypothetical protein SteCoe_18562 [Stentor coeruleus]